MEVPRVLRLSESLNKSKVQHMIFTLDGNTFKSFGDELSMKVLRQNGEVCKKIRLYTYSESTLESIASSKQIEWKMLRLTVTDLKERLLEGDISSYSWLSTEDMWADMLTRDASSTTP